MKRTRKTRHQARLDFHHAVCDMWSDIHSGRVNMDTLDIDMYSKRYNISKYGKRFYTDIITQPFLPSMQETIELRKRIVSELRSSAIGVTDLGDDDSETESSGLTEEACIAHLLGTGKYVIARIVTA